MESLGFEEENITKGIRILFRLKKELNYSARNLFRLEKKRSTIKDRILVDIKNLFEDDEEENYKPVRVSNF